MVDGQRPGGDLLAGRGADDGCAEDQALGVGHHLDMAADFALGLGAVVVMVGPAQHADGAVALARLHIGQADMGELRIGEGHARDLVDVHLDRQAEQQMADQQARPDGWRNG